MDWPLAASPTSAASNEGGRVLLRPPPLSHHARSASCDWNEADSSPARPVRPTGRESSSDLSSAEENYFEGSPRRRGPALLHSGGAAASFQRCGSVPPDLGLSTSPKAAAHSPNLTSAPGQRAASTLHHRSPFSALPATTAGAAAREVDFGATPFGRQHHHSHHHRHHQSASSSPAVNPQGQRTQRGWKNRTHKWQWLWHRKGGGVDLSERGAKEGADGGGGASSRDSSTDSAGPNGPPASAAAIAMGMKRSFRANPHISCPDISSASSDSESMPVHHHTIHHGGGLGGHQSPTLPFKVSISSIFQRPSSSSSSQRSSQRLPRNSSLRYQQQQQGLPRSALAAAVYIDPEDSPNHQQQQQAARLTRKRTLTGTPIGGLRVEVAAAATEAGKGSASDKQDSVAPLARYKVKEQTCGREHQHTWANRIYRVSSSEVDLKMSTRL